MAQKPEFQFFGWGDKDPINKYTQPKPNTHDTGNNGYPEKDCNFGTVPFMIIREP